MNLTSDKRLPMNSLSYCSTRGTVTIRPYYYFFYGIGPPIGLRQLEKEAVGGWNARGFFYGSQEAFNPKIKGIRNSFMFRGCPPRTSGFV